MKNKEKFASEIVEIAISGCSSFAVSKSTGKPDKCSEINCENCAFNKTGETCNELCREWAESEYKEPITAERLDREHRKVCLGTKCSKCKYNQPIANCYGIWLLENYDVKEKEATE